MQLSWLENDVGLRKLIRKLLPRRLMLMRQRRATARFDEQVAGKSEQDVFSKIYADGLWGSSLNKRFYSGSGSHDPAVVSPYASSISAFLKSFPTPPTVVDLGCGDFNVGGKIAPDCGKYIGCDIVPMLIDQNRVDYASPKVAFECLNLVSDELPRGDVVLIRQVLQHLSNAQIQSALPKLAAFKYIVVTEHLPTDPNFVANVDQPPGIGIRLVRTPPSGVVLTAVPFSLKVRTSRELCTVSEGQGVIQTTLYET